MILPVRDPLNLLASLPVVWNRFLPSGRAVYLQRLPGSPGFFSHPVQDGGILFFSAEMKNCFGSLFLMHLLCSMA
jgi:hypothetical protein